MISILGIVVAYKPDIRVLCEDINSFIDDVNRVVVWMNSDFDAERVAGNVRYPEKLSFMGDKENVGIGKAFNTVIKACGKQYDFILTMDQDSKWENFREYAEHIASGNRNEKNIYGPCINVDPEFSESARDVVVDHVITSGCMLPLAVFYEAGYFNEPFFIDAVDEEFCYRAKEYGYRIVQTGSGRLLQTFGSPKIRNILGKKISFSEYSPIRLYYQARNHLFLVRAYRLEKKTRTRLILRYAFLPFFDILFYQSAKREKVAALFKGIAHGLSVKAEKMKNV